MFALVNFTEVYRFNIFAKTQISATLDNITLLGRVDELIASGFRSPQIPIFAFNEYKKANSYSRDPQGQALAAMLVGQWLNNDQQPIYGCCVVGSIWRFMVLEKKYYAISSILDGAEVEDAYQILRILQQLKQYCLERTETWA